MIHELQNDLVKIKINSFGAELKSLVSTQTGREYMWSSDPTYWKRSSPVLFPFVGRLNGQKYHYNGKTYEMTQHGFARDNEFEVLEKSDNRIAFVFTDNAQTRRIYPFGFKFIQEYELSGRKVIVRWKVINTDDKIMYFSVGAHPAFMCPLNAEEKTCRLQFDVTGPLSYRFINSASLVADKTYSLPMKNNIWSFTKDVFDNDAFIFENYQMKSIAMLDENNKPYLTVHFQAPAVGIWSPPHKNAPFVCIEPWYGRCDAAGFSGELQDREFGNSLAGGAEFITQYDIEI